MNSHQRIAAAVALAYLPIALAAAPESRTLRAGTPASVSMDAAKLDEAVALYRRAVERDDLRGAAGANEPTARSSSGRGSRPTIRPTIR